MPDSLQGWLVYIESQHPQPIALGLDRVKTVSAALSQHKTCPVVTVAGTNGKGSVCAMLESILSCAGYRVGLYTSPHLLRYNERVRIDRSEVSDNELCRAFAAVEAARGEVLLTYFEYGTLAAWQVFAHANVDVIVLEVGLGGRLDAVNIYDSDCAVVTTVDLDHMNFLGNDREEIGFEKAGIFRRATPAICGDAIPPATLLQYANSVSADLKLINRDFGYIRQEQQWQFWNWRGKRSGLAYPALRGGMQLINASTALAALDSVGEKLPVAMQDIRRGLMEVKLPGRFQVMAGQPTVVLDVAHNPQAATVLAQNLGNMQFHPETWAIFGIMADKDIAGVIRAIRSRVDKWLVCALPGVRAATTTKLKEILETEGVKQLICEFESPAKALIHALGHASEADRIVAFGSFLTVADAMTVLAPAFASTPDHHA